MSIPLTREQIAEVFERHEGSQTRVLALLDPPVVPCAVTNWLKGRYKSSRVEKVLRAYAEKLIAEEQSIATGGIESLS